MSDQDRPTTIEPTIRPGMRGYWLIAITLTVISLVVLPFDFAFSNPHLFEDLPGDLTRIIGLSEVFSHGFGVLLASIGIWVLVKPKRKFIPRIIVCAFWPALGALLLKSLMGRYRPIRYFDEMRIANFPASISDTWLGWMPRDPFNIVYGSESFPSAHSVTGWGLAIGLAWLFPQGRWLFFCVATLGSIQRITSSAHWASDIVFGAAIAFLMAGAITQNWGFGYLLGRFEIRNTVDLLVQEEITDRRAA